MTLFLQCVQVTWQFFQGGVGVWAPFSLPAVYRVSTQQVLVTS